MRYFAIRTDVKMLLILLLLLVHESLWHHILAGRILIIIINSVIRTFKCILWSHNLSWHDNVRSTESSSVSGSLVSSLLNALCFLLLKHANVSFYRISSASSGLELLFLLSIISSMLLPLNRGFSLVGKLKFILRPFWIISHRRLPSKLFLFFLLHSLHKCISETASRLARAWITTCPRSVIIIACVPTEHSNQIAYRISSTSRSLQEILTRY